jgi:predicted TIM-barrel fold metal-dependent hydrolase
LKTAAENMRELSDAAQRKILGDNAAKLYRL